MKDEKSQLIETKFEAALNVIRGLPKNGPYQPSHDMMLKFYGLYKQATEGPCKEPKPSFFEVVRGYKWKAWNANGDMSKEQAMDMYVEELKKIVETMSYSDDVAQFIQTLGPFYEFVEIPALKNNLADKNHNVSKRVSKRDEILNEGDHSKKEYFIVEQEENIPHSSLQRGKIYTNGHRSSKKDGREKMAFNDVRGDCNGKKSIGENAEYEDVLYSNGVELNQSSNFSGKFVSDTESDEEYSEPAECLEVLEGNGGRIFNNGNRFEEASEELNNQLQKLTPFQATQTGSTQGMPDCGEANASGVNRLNIYGSNYGQGSNGDYTNGAGFSRSGGLLPSGGSGSSGGGGDRRRGNSGQQRSVSNNELDSNIIVILRKIQQDIESVAHRMDDLELQALQRHNETCGYCQRHLHSSPLHTGRGTSQWPFAELSSRTTFLLLAWPLILGGAISLLKSFRRRNQRRPF